MTDHFAGDRRTNRERMLAGDWYGDNSVTGAGAVVTGDVPTNVPALGNPARALREIP